MAPSTVDRISPPQSDGELTKAGIKNIVQETAASIAPSNGTSDLQELDASKLTFTCNLNPKAVPAPGSAEEESSAV